jgi:AraC family transcriptional regulator
VNFIERVKLEQAANLLCVMKTKSVEDIACYCGYKSISSFSRAFKKYHGIPPVKFLQVHKHDFHSLNIAAELRLKKTTERDISSVSIKKIPGYHVIYVQTLEGYRTGIPKAWANVTGYAQFHNLWNNPSCLLGLPYNNPGITPYEKCRYRACIPVSEDIQLTKGTVKTLTIEPSTCAVIHFVGKRENITEAYSFLYGTWLIQSGYIPDEKPLLELYPADLMLDCKREIMEYDIALPVKPI